MLDSWGGNCKLVCDRVSEDTGFHWRHTGEGGLTSMSAEMFPMPCSRHGQRDPHNNMGHDPQKAAPGRLRMRLKQKNSTLATSSSDFHQYPERKG